MCEVLTSRDIIFIIVTLTFSIIEFYLGRSEKVKSSSILELIYNLIVAILRLKKMR